MEETQAYYDFCIPYTKNEKLLREICEELYGLKYRTIAIEQVFDHSQKDQIKRGTDIFPEPINIKWLQTAFENKLKILQRLTIIYDDVAVSHAMINSLNLKKFHLIAGQPTDDNALNHCCTSFNGDLLTFDSEIGGRLQINRKSYKIAIQRGLFFEIKYSEVISNSRCRKDIIKLAHNYFVKGKSKNVIISSGAKSAFELRSPNDVAHLSFIFGLSIDQGKCAVDRYCRMLFLKAESRRYGKTIMIVKASGPIVFSDSSDDESDLEMLRKADDNIIEEAKETDSANGEIPNKKAKFN